jgi:hypothetical protein
VAGEEVVSDGARVEEVRGMVMVLTTVTGTQVVVEPMVEVDEMISVVVTVVQSQDVVVPGRGNVSVMPVLDSVPTTVLVSVLETVRVVVGSGVAVGQTTVVRVTTGLQVSHGVVEVGTVGEIPSMMVTVPQLSQGLVAASAEPVDVTVGVSVKVVDSQTSHGGATVGDTEEETETVPVCESAQSVAVTVSVSVTVEVSVSVTVEVSVRVTVEVSVRVIVEVSVAVTVRVLLVTAHWVPLAENVSFSVTTSVTVVAYCVTVEAARADEAAAKMEQ